MHNRFHHAGFSYFVCPFRAIPLAIPNSVITDSYNFCIIIFDQYKEGIMHYILCTCVLSCILCEKKSLFMIKVLLHLHLVPRIFQYMLLFQNVRNELNIFYNVEIDSYLNLTRGMVIYFILLFMMKVLLHLHLVHKIFQCMLLFIVCKKRDKYILQYRPLPKFN